MYLGLLQSRTKTVFRLFFLGAYTFIKHISPVLIMDVTQISDVQKNPKHIHLYNLLTSSLT